jgi:acyl-CoA dehydrogenase
MDSAFMNGPIHGHDVFVPVDWVIGGEANIGRGWRMLMESLAAGRAISLPALGAALQQSSLYVAHGYGTVREQFGLQIGKFHAVAGVIARMAVDLYATDAARRFTAAALDRGESPSVASAILKVQLTEAGRRAVNHAMDILGGKGIMRGPSNLLAVAYCQAPIAITVEGANILTRALIIFGQGAVRCHPYVFEEMSAVQAGDATRLGAALLGHLRHVARNLVCSLFSAPVIGQPPADLRKEARLIARLSAKYALTADLAMGMLGGKLKRMELLSARLGDVLAHLYLATASVWRYEVEGDAALLPFARAAVRVELDRAASTLRDLYANLPSPARRWLGWIILRGTGFLAPLRDRQLLAFTESLRAEPRLIARLCPDVTLPKSGGMLDLMRALELAAELGDEAPALNKLVRRAESLEAAAQSASDPARALAYLLAADRVIQVDDFPRERWSAPPPVRDG